MATPVSTTVTELPESRVRVQAEVPAEEVEKRVAVAARALGRNLRIPGFRKGKVPPPVIIQRVGREAVLDEAVRESIAGWYSAAIGAAKVVPVGEPDLDLEDLPAEGEPLRFSIEIGVRPTATLGDYRGLEVGRRDPEVADEAIDAEVEQLRDRMAKLETVERPAETGDFVVMDFLGSIDGVPFGGGEGRDQMVELGSGRLVPGFEDQLAGASAGEEKTVTIDFPDDYGAAELAGKQAEFAVTVKEVKAKELPELDEDFAAEAGFDTIEELREDIRERLAEAQEREIEAEFREAALDAAVAAATVEVPEPLIEARAKEMWDEMAHTLSHQGISREMFLQYANKSEEELTAENREPAERDLRREAVLAAVVEAEGIEASEDDVLESLERAAAAEGGGSPKKLLERLRSSGRVEALKADIAQRKAIEHIAESAKPVKVEQSTEERAAASGLWTPGS
jgi:trigger factor